METLREQLGIVFDKVFFLEDGCSLHDALFRADDRQKASAPVERDPGTAEKVSSEDWERGCEPERFCCLSDDDVFDRREGSVSEI